MPFLFVQVYEGEEPREEEEAGLRRSLPADQRRTQVGGSFTWDRADEPESVFNCQCVFTVIFLKERTGRERKPPPSVTGDPPAGNAQLQSFGGGGDLSIVCQCVRVLIKPTSSVFINELMN